MLTMDKIHGIRFRFYVKGENISQIANVLQLDWKTVQKYVDMTDFNEPAPKQDSEQRFCPKLDPYKPTIDKWLEEDKQAPRKQRHTAKRVFHRLRKEIHGFDCSYRTVASYYAIKHKEVFSGARGGFLPLEHNPGESQVDFGTADFYENGTRITGKYLEVSFPYSNKGYMQLFYGEIQQLVSVSLLDRYKSLPCIGKIASFFCKIERCTKLLATLKTRRCSDGYIA